MKLFTESYFPTWSFFWQLTVFLKLVYRFRKTSWVVSVFMRRFLRYGLDILLQMIIKNLIQSWVIGFSMHARQIFLFRICYFWEWIFVALLSDEVLLREMFSFVINGRTTQAVENSRTNIGECARTLKWNKKTINTKEQ